MEEDNLPSFDEIDTIYGGIWTNGNRPCETPDAFQEKAYLLKRMEGTKRQWQIVGLTICNNKKKPEILESELNIWDGIKLLREYTEELRIRHKENAQYEEMCCRLYSGLDSLFNSGAFFGEYGLPAIERRLRINKPEPELPVQSRYSLTELFLKMNDQDPK